MKTFLSQDVFYFDRVGDQAFNFELLCARQIFKTDVPAGEKEMQKFLLWVPLVTEE